MWIILSALKSKYNKEADLFYDLSLYIYTYVYIVVVVVVVVVVVELLYFNVGFRIRARPGAAPDCLTGVARPV